MTAIWRLVCRLFDGRVRELERELALSRGPVEYRRIPGGCEVWVMGRLVYRTGEGVVG